MTLILWGAVLGALAGVGLLMVASRVRVIRHPQLAVRVLPYLRDLPGVGTRPELTAVAPAPPSVVAAVFGPPLRAMAAAMERLLGGSVSVRRRLERADLDRSVHEFRIEQVIWGVVGFALAAGYGVLRAVGDPGSGLASLLVCVVAFVAGALARDTYLSTQVKRREGAILAEFPAIAELLALAVAAGEGPVAALDRVVRRSGGQLSGDLARVLAAVRTGEPVGAAFDRLAARTGLLLVARFAQGVAVAVERGTPLADVLHAQAGDVREAGRRELIEIAARKEVVMMVPVVFLILPVTVLFAFWPGVIGLSLTTP